MSISGQINSQTESASYTYDNVGRLVTSSQTTGGTSAQRRFAYDRWGNRTGVWDAVSGGTQIQSITLEQSGGAPTNRITSVNNGGAVNNYTYDAAGNVTSDGVNNYQYDAENRIVSVNSGSTASYSYDHQNRRVQTVASGVTTHYVWEGSSVIAEHNGSTGAVLTEYIFAGGRMIAREDGGGRKYLLSDRLSIRATITDGQGSIQATQGHLPFGEAMGGSADKHRFTSYEREASTGLDYAVNRWHSPGVGRFLQADPYRASGGAGAPQSWNRYSYVANEPINGIDPLGLYCIYIPFGETGLLSVCVPQDGSGTRPGFETPNSEGDVSGGGGVVDANVDFLIKALENLPPGCVEFFGGQQTINDRINEIRSGTLPIQIVRAGLDSAAAQALIPHTRRTTFQQYWTDLPRKVKNHSWAFTVNFGGQTHPYNSIILRPDFWITTDTELMKFVNGDTTKFQQYTLVHEFMHVLNRIGDTALFEKWEREGAILDPNLEKSRALFKFLADGCPKKN